MSISLPAYLSRPHAWWVKAARTLAAWMPKGLYARSLLIVILPMVLLQSAIAYFFMERHWQTVTQRLSSAVVSDIAALVDLLNAPAGVASFQTLSTIADRRFNFTVQLGPREPLPPALPKPFFSVLDSALSRELAVQIKQPYWLDTVGNSKLIEIRVQTDAGVLRVITRATTHTRRTRIFSSHGWSRHRSCCSASPSRFCATRSGQSCALRKRLRISARDAILISAARRARSATGGLRLH